MSLLAEAEGGAGSVLTALAAHVFAGGIAATWLLVVCKIGEFVGNDTCESRIGVSRRVSYDSDAIVGGGLAAIGGVAGLVIAISMLANGGDAAAYWPLSAIAGGLLGLVAALPIVRYFAKQYLNRAAANLEQGNYKEAIQDAHACIRLAKSMTPEAAHIEGNALIKSGRRERGEQLLRSIGADFDADFVGDATSYGNASYTA